MKEGDDSQHKPAIQGAPLDQDFVFFDDPWQDRPPDTSDTEQRAFEYRRVLSVVIELITRKATPKRCGQRAFAVAHALRLGTCRTQRDLAKKLRVTPGRVSQILNEVKRELGL